MQISRFLLIAISPFFVGVSLFAFNTKSHHQVNPKIPSNQNIDIYDAQLKVDSEANKLFFKIKDLIAANQHLETIPVLNSLLAKHWKDLAFVEENLHIPTEDKVKNILKSLPKETLSSYCTLNDTLAGDEIKKWKKQPWKEEYLNLVFNNYFMTNYGDDAAYYLGCLNLNKGKYHQAILYFDNMINNHPNVNINQNEFIPRYTLAMLRSGQVNKARKHWEKYTQDKPQALQQWKSLNDEIKLLVNKNKKQNLSENHIYNDSRRSKAFKFDPNLQHSPLWSTTWKKHISPELIIDSKARQFLHPRVGQGENMKRYQVRPSDSIVVEDKHIWYNSAPYIYKYSIGNTNTSWKVKNNFPKEANDQRFFHRFMSKKWILKRYLRGDFSSMDYYTYHSTMERKLSLGKNFAYRLESHEKFNGNSLAAYDKNNGKLIWRIKVDKVKIKNRRKSHWRGAALEKYILFESYPVSYRNHILVTVREPNGLFIWALNPLNGNTLWKTQLDQAIQITGYAKSSFKLNFIIENDELFIFYRNAIFCLNPLNGNVKWAKELSRADLDYNLEIGSINNLDSKNKGSNLNWEDNHFILKDKLLFVMPADLPGIIAIDTKKKSVQWSVLKTHNIDYVAGIARNNIIFAGLKKAMALNVETGEKQWELDLATSYGKGFVTENAFFVPHNYEILKINPGDGKVITKLKVHKEKHQPPVGNIWPHKDTFLVAGPNMVYQLADMTKQIKKIDHSLAGKSTAEELIIHGYTTLKFKDYEKSFQIAQKLININKDKTLEVKISDLLLKILSKNTNNKIGESTIEIIKHRQINKNQSLNFKLLSALVLENKEQFNKAAEQYFSITKASHDTLLTHPDEPGLSINSRQLAWINLSKLAEKIPSIKKNTLDAIEQFKNNALTDLENNDPIQLIDYTRTFPQHTDKKIVDRVFDHYMSKNTPGSAWAFLERVKYSVNDSLKKHIIQKQQQIIPHKTNSPHLSQTDSTLNFHLLSKTNIKLPTLTYSKIFNNKLGYRSDSERKAGVIDLNTGTTSFAPYFKSISINNLIRCSNSIYPEKKNDRLNFIDALKGHSLGSIQHHPEHNETSFGLSPMAFQGTIFDHGNGLYVHDLLSKKIIWKRNQLFDSDKFIPSNGIFRGNTLSMHNSLRKYEEMMRLFSKQKSEKPINQFEDQMISFNVFTGEKVERFLVQDQHKNVNPKLTSKDEDIQITFHKKKFILTASDKNGKSLWEFNNVSFYEEYGNFVVLRKTGENNAQYSVIIINKNDGSNIYTMKNKHWVNHRMDPLQQRIFLSTFTHPFLVIIDLKSGKILQKFKLPKNGKFLDWVNQNHILVKITHRKTFRQSKTKIYRSGYQFQIINFKTNEVIFKTPAIDLPRHRFVEDKLIITGRNGEVLTYKCNTSIKSFSNL